MFPIVTTLKPGQLIQIKFYEFCGSTRTDLKNKVVMYLGESNGQNNGAFPTIDVLVDDRIETLTYSSIQYSLVK